MTMEQSDFMRVLDRRARRIKRDNLHAKYQYHGRPGEPGLRSAQILALAEHVCELTRRVEALERLK